jgi:hypothetical protein
MTRSIIVSFWANFSQISVGAEWNFIKGYWDFTLTFLFWSISFSKDVEVPLNTFEVVKTKKAK